jgi:hypothetical protein
MTRRPWTTVALPAAVTSVRSMLSDEERQYLTWLTAERYEGWGAIVELGVWLGSSSVALAEGLRRSGATAIIRSFDLFRWEEYMAEAVSTELKPGDDFLPLYLRETSAYAPQIQARKVDLMTCSWDGGPIEMLFVDSAKTWELTNAILNGFGPHLVPGRSRVVLQDFRYHFAHCLPLIFDSRPDVWKQVEDVESGSTVTFMPLRPLFGRGGITADYAEDSFPLASADHLLKSRIAREEPAAAAQLKAMLYRKYLIDGPMDEARRLREELLAGGFDASEMKVLEDIEYILHPRAFAAMEQGDYAAARAIAERCLAVPGKRTAYSLNLLGFALLRSGERAGAERTFDEILTMAPGFPSAVLARVELALEDGRVEDAAAGARDVLDAQPADELTIQWATNLLARASTPTAPDDAG